MDDTTRLMRYKIAKYDYSTNIEVSVIAGNQEEALAIAKRSLEDLVLYESIGDNVAQVTVSFTTQDFMLRDVDSWAELSRAEWAQAVLRRAREAYDRDGQSSAIATAVTDGVKSWGYCSACECDVPQVNDTCVVCWSTVTQEVAND